MSYRLIFPITSMICLLMEITLLMSNTVSDRLFSLALNLFNLLTIGLYFRTPSFNRVQIDDTETYHLQLISSPVTSGWQFVFLSMWIGTICLVFPAIMVIYGFWGPYPSEIIGWTGVGWYIGIGVLTLYFLLYAGMGHGDWLRIMFQFVLLICVITGIYINISLTGFAAAGLFGLWIAQVIQMYEPTFPFMR